MSTIKELARHYARAFVTDKNPASGRNDPAKPDFIAFGVKVHDEVEALKAGQLSGMRAFEFLAELQAVTGTVPDEGASVWGDSEANNGIYRWNDPTDTWVKVGDAIPLNQEARIDDLEALSGTYRVLEVTSETESGGVWFIATVGDPPITALRDGDTFLLRPTMFNPVVAVVLNVGTGNIGIREQNGEILSEGRIRADQDLVVRWQDQGGTSRFVILEPSSELVQRIGVQAHIELTPTGGDNNDVICDTIYPIYDYPPYSPYRVKWPSTNSRDNPTLTVKFERGAGLVEGDTLTLYRADGSIVPAGGIRAGQWLELRWIAGVPPYFEITFESEMPVAEGAPDELDLEELSREVRRLFTRIEDQEAAVALELEYASNFAVSNPEWRFQQSYATVEALPLLPIVDDGGVPCVEMDLNVHSTTHRQRVGGVATLTFATAHGKLVGEPVNVYGIEGYSGEYEITAVGGGGTTLSYANAGSDEVLTADANGKMTAVVMDMNHTYPGIGWLQIPFVAPMLWLRAAAETGKKLRNFRRGTIMYHMKTVGLYLPKKSKMNMFFYTLNPTLDEGRGQHVYFLQTRDPLHERLGFSGIRQAADANSVTATPFDDDWIQVTVPFSPDPNDWQPIGARPGYPHFSADDDVYGALKNVYFNLGWMFTHGNTVEAEADASDLLHPQPSNPNPPPTDMPRGIIRVRDVQIHLEPHT